VTCFHGWWDRHY